MLRASLIALTSVPGLLAWSGVGVALVLLHVTLTGTLVWGFLLWNLVLAWVPLLCVLAAERLKRTRAGVALAGAALVCWLLFFPNAPYLVTDGIHVITRDPPFPAITAAATAICAVVGLGLGYASLAPLHAALARRRGALVGHGFVAAVLALCSVGVYLGRVLRWNSWDALASPGAIAADAVAVVLDPLAHPRGSAFTLAFALALAVGYALWTRLAALAPSGGSGGAAASSQSP